MMIFASRGKKIFKNYNYMAGDEEFIKNLLESVKTRDMTEDELGRLEKLFIKTYGYLPPNLCLHPQWLMNKWYQEENEDKEVEAWLMNEEIAFLENAPKHIKTTDISFMCENPQQCKSFQKQKFACRCIRQTFSKPSEFEAWAKRELTELKISLKESLQLKD